MFLPMNQRRSPNGRTPYYTEVGADPSIAPGLDLPPGSVVLFGTDYFRKFDTGATDWEPTPWNSSTGTAVVADWALGATRYYAVGAGGNDGSAGFSDSSAAAAWAVRKLTWAGLLAILPRIGAGRDVQIMVGPAAYGEDFKLYGFVGWRNLHVVATTDGSDDATDRILSGCVQAFAGSGAAGVWTATGASTAAAITKGDAAALPSEANGLLRRVRFTGNVTAGLANQTRPIWQISGAVATLGVNSSAAAANGDTFHIEKAGAIFLTVAIGGCSAVNFAMRGISSAGAWDEFGVRANARTLTACEAASTATFIDFNSLAFSYAYRGIDGVVSIQGFGFRASGLIVKNGETAAGLASGTFAGGMQFARIKTPDWGDQGCVCFGGDTGNAVLVESSGASRNVFGCAAATTTRPFRIEGRLTLAQFRGTVQHVQIQNAASPIVLTGHDNRVLFNSVTGATGNTGIALRLDECNDSLADIDTATMAVSAAGGDLIFAGNAVGVFEDLAKTNVHDQRGNEARDRTTGTVVGPGQCALAINSVGALAGPGLLAFYDGLASSTISLSDRTALNGGGARCDVVTITQAGAGAPVYVAKGGRVFVQAEAGAAGEVAYVGSTPGVADSTLGGSGDFTLRVGFFSKDTNVSNENYLILQPSTQIILLDEEVAMADNGSGDSTEFTLPTGFVLCAPKHNLLDADEDDEVFLAFTNIRLQIYYKKTANAGEWVVSWRNDGGHGNRNMRVVVMAERLPEPV
jgi:hypothetical protein